MSYEHIPYVPRFRSSPRPKPSRWRIRKEVRSVVIDRLASILKDPETSTGTFLKSVEVLAKLDMADQRAISITLGDISDRVIENEPDVDDLELTAIRHGYKLVPLEDGEAGEIIKERILALNDRMMNPGQP